MNPSSSAKLHQNKIHMKKEKIKLGLVVGRFQPLHGGHRYLIKTAIAENDNIVVCIGSAQKADPLSLEERHKRLSKFLKDIDLTNKILKTITMEDTPSDEVWLSQLNKKAGVVKHNENTFYTAETLSEEYLNMMKNTNFNIKTIERSLFQYRDPSGKAHNFFCATQIREVHKKLNLGNI